MGEDFPAPLAHALGIDGNDDALITELVSCPRHEIAIRYRRRID
jgi:hypothetical protein